MCQKTAKTYLILIFQKAVPSMNTQSLQGKIYYLCISMNRMQQNMSTLTIKMEEHKINIFLNQNFS